jgi:hypothetical protein
MREILVTASLLFVVLAPGLAVQAALQGDLQRGLISADQAPTPTKPEIFDRILSELYRKRQFNGVVLVADKGEIIFKRAYGLADFEKRVPLTTSYSFNLASVSKPFTAMCIMILENQGKLRFDDQVAKHLPGFPYEGVTIRHLLNHTLESEFSISVARRGGRLFARGTGQQEFEIFPESETTFFYTLLEAKLSFVRDGGGEVVEVVLHQGGGESRGRKITKER